MPIKKIHVGFDIDADVFMKMLQHASSGMKIEVFGDTPKLAKRDQPKLLAAPSERGGARKLMLAFLLAHKERGVKPTELREVCVAAGYAPATHSPILTALQIAGMIKKLKDGTYQATPKAVSNGEERS
jgi:hypothetical protein